MRRLSALALIVTMAGCSSDSATAPDRPITAVGITPATSALVVGQTAQLSATVTGGFANPTITWTSSNASVASVGDSGRITAKAAGVATITATAGGVSGTAGITVATGAIDNVTVCDRASASSCVSSVALPANGTSVAVRASAFNTVGADVSASCTFTWAPNVQNVVSISFFGDATKRDALITRTATGITSIVVSCGGVPGVFTIG